MPEMEFGEPQEFEQQEQEPVEEGPGEPEPEPEPEEEEVQAEEDRLGRLERAVSELVDWARTSAQQKPAAQAPPQQRPRPNFGENTAAQVLYDEIAAVRQENEERWNRVEAQRAENEQLQTAYASLVDQAETYVAQRAQEGDPKLSVQEIMPIVAQMGLLKDRRIPVTRAFELAYNAAAYKTAKQMARNQGQQDVRRPDAKVPAEYRPRPAGARPQARPQTQQSAAKPGSLDERTRRLKREMEELDSKLGRLSPDEVSDALGG